MRRRELRDQSRYYPEGGAASTSTSSVDAITRAREPGRAAVQIS
jgi:hypothetical protein